MTNRLLALFVPTWLAACTVGCAWLRPDPPRYDSVQLEDGLSVRDVVVPVEGPAAAVGDEVAIHYEMRLADRTLVESSRDTGQPVRFRVGDGVLPRGLEQGIVGMRLFGRRRLSVPSELAFGATGRPPRIPPDAAVLFDVELMELVPAAR
jgi:FKBP-type peptidyl-prolyl cis-trans isomerase